MLVYVIKKISCSKLKETYSAIFLHINCRHSFCKTLESATKLHDVTFHMIFLFIDTPSELQTSHIYGESASAQFYLFLVDRLPIEKMLYVHGNAVGWF